MNVPEIFFCSTGEKIEVEFKGGMFRAIVNGVEFCSMWSAGLIEALRLFHTVQSSDPKLKPTRTQELLKILSSDPLLEERQKALDELESLAKGDIFAREAVERVKSRTPSIAARYITMIMNKSDFSHVTAQEISDYIPDVVERSALVKELGSRVKL
jgi:hypothetical protein